MKDEVSGDDLPSRIGRLMLFLAWIVGLAILMLAFQRFMDQGQHPNQDIDVSLDAAGRPQVILARNHVGHYLAPGRINGQPVIFLIDTGATDVALPLALAERLNLRLVPGSIARTANGDVQAWSALLDEVDLSGLVARRVRASVLPNLPGDQVLLGMRYLKRFVLLQREGTLTVRAPK